jgi:ketosteroid isomerase-like protein
MRPFPRIALLIVLGPLLLPAQGSAQQGTDSTEVVATVAAFHQALVRGDSVAALALLAPDALILEAGGIETREEYRSHHLAADIGFVRAVPAVSGPIRVVIVNHVAWATSTSTSQGTFEGRPIQSQGAELMVLTRTTMGWRIRAIHWSSRARRRES